MSFFDKIYDIAHTDLFKYVFHSGSDKVFVANISKIMPSENEMAKKLLMNSFSRVLVDCPLKADRSKLSSDVTWSSTNAEEMKCFIGINILMGIHNLPEYRDYWSSDLALKVPYVSNKMSRHRYEKLCEYMYLHCSDPNNADPEDKR